MAAEAELILRTLDRHLTARGRVRLLGGAALILGYGMNRATEDADLVMEDAEVLALMGSCGFSEALDATNRELNTRGLYLTHIWGPEQQILTGSWLAACRPVVVSPRFERLEVDVLGPLDLICSKLARADAADLADIRYLISTQGLTADEVRAAVHSARVPPALAEIFPQSRVRLEGLLEVMASTPT